MITNRARARGVLAATAAAAAVVVLAGCEKPTPGISAFSGTESVRTQALCWSPEATGSVDAKACAQQVANTVASGGDVPTLRVTGDATLGISVDPVVADNGWNLSINGTPINADPITETYYRITYPQAGANIQLPATGSLQVIALGEGGQKVRGVWGVRTQLINNE